MEKHFYNMKKIWPDDELSLYKVMYMDQEHYCVWESIADVLDWYEDKDDVTSIEFIDTTYLSPWIFKLLK